VLICCSGASQVLVAGASMTESCAAWLWRGGCSLCGLCWWCGLDEYISGWAMCWCPLTEQNLCLWTQTVPAMRYPASTWNEENQVGCGRSPSANVYILKYVLERIDSKEKVQCLDTTVIETCPWNWTMNSLSSPSFYLLPYFNSFYVLPNYEFYNVSGIQFRSHHF
jgi:hypothetical protein